MSLSLMGCGYKFTVKKVLPIGVDKVFVEIFENKTDEVGLESLLTNEFLIQMARYLPLRVISKTRDDSTSIIKGEITSLYSDVISYDKNYTCTLDTTRHRMVGTVKLSLQNKGGITIWSIIVIETHDYDLFSDDNTKNTKRQEAISELMVQLSKSTFQRLTENF